MTVYSYAIAANWNVALVSLTNVETLCGLPPLVGLVNRYPIRTRVLSGREYGDGTLSLTWSFGLMSSSLFKSAIRDTLHTNGTVVSAQVTLYTREADGNTYNRWNAWSHLPIQGEDYTYRERFMENLSWRFTLVTQL
jgi:hypothetical protein